MTRPKEKPRTAGPDDHGVYTLSEDEAPESCRVVWSYVKGGVREFHLDVYIDGEYRGHLTFQVGKKRSRR